MDAHSTIWHSWDTDTSMCGDKNALNITTDMGKVNCDECLRLENDDLDAMADAVIAFSDTKYGHPTPATGEVRQATPVPKRPVDIQLDAAERAMWPAIGEVRQEKLCGHLIQPEIRCNLLAGHPAPSFYVDHQWRGNRVPAPLPDPASNAAGPLTYEQKRTHPWSCDVSRGDMQCDFTTSHGDDGFLCCTWKMGHPDALPHSDCYNDGPHPDKRRWYKRDPAHSTPVGPPQYDSDWPPEQKQAYAYERMKKIAGLLDEIGDAKAQIAELTKGEV